MKKSEIFIKIRNYHSDNHNHVNNARYLEFFEESSWDFLEKNPHVGEMFASLIKKDIIHVVVNINCNFKSSAIVGDLLRIETKLMRSTNRSYTWSKEIFNNETDKLVVDAEVTCVFINSASGEVFPINEKMKSIWPELAEKKVEGNNLWNSNFQLAVDVFINTGNRGLRLFSCNSPKADNPRISFTFWNCDTIRYLYNIRICDTLDYLHITKI